VQARARGLAPGSPGWPADGYAGEYIGDIAKELSDTDDLDAVRKYAVAYLRKEQDADLQAFGVKFDVYYLESSLYSEGKVDAAVKGLVASGKTYETDGALLHHRLRDDKDRVAQVRRQYTYFVPMSPTIRRQRGFRKVINVQGTDHHSA
jgi:arginyl-tRNA synthetase